MTKDEKANFEDKMSAIGGIMGLFMGFSILSVVEVIYFAAKASLVRIMTEKKNRVRFFRGQNKENINEKQKCCSVQLPGLTR